MSEPGEEERPDIQKKVFGRWINAKLRRRDVFVTDLYFDFSECLLDLLSSLTERDLKQEQVSRKICTTFMYLFFSCIASIVDIVEYVTTTNFDIDIFWHL